MNNFLNSGKKIKQKFQNLGNGLKKIILLEKYYLESQFRFLGELKMPIF
jgi:hypothetical protein